MAVFQSVRGGIGGISIESKLRVAMKKIYCAGPLFNDSEKNEMDSIAQVLEGAGYEVFLPHRDGLEYANLYGDFESLGVASASAREILNKAIFYLDVYHVLDSDGLVLNINGRVPDEGAMVEAGIAWGNGKPVCIYKKDARTLIAGSDNPMITGLSNFSTFDSVEAIPSFFMQTLHGESQAAVSPAGYLPVDNIRRLGEDIANAIESGLNSQSLCRKLLNILC